MIEPARRERHLLVLRALRTWNATKGRHRA
jgi:hypothetical protein